MPKVLTEVFGFHSGCLRVLPNVISHLDEPRQKSALQSFFDFL